MSAETREVGMKWTTRRIEELSREASIPVNVHWEADVANEHAQFLMIELSGTTHKWEIANLDLEDDTRRSQLERVIRAVVDALQNTGKQEGNNSMQERAISLTTVEQDVLVEALEKAIPPLREEIVRATEDHAYRDTLREKERLLNVVLEKLKAAE